MHQGDADQRCVETTAKPRPREEASQQIKPKAPSSPAPSAAGQAKRPRIQRRLGIDSQLLGGCVRRTDKDLAKIPSFIGEYIRVDGRSQSWTHVDPTILPKEKTNPSRFRRTRGSFAPTRSCTPFRRTTIRAVRPACRCAAGHFFDASCPSLSQSGSPRQAKRRPLFQIRLFDFDDHVTIG
jgi:hypothetical protein